MLYKDLANYNKKFYLKPFIKIHASRLEEEELLMVKNSDRVTTITEEEADILKNLTGVKCEIVANGIEPVLFSYKFDKTPKKNILFVGNFSYFPNVDGIEFFLKEIFPKLSKDLTLTVIGKNVLRVVKDKNPRIVKKEFVEDIISEYRNSDILVFPIRIGGGTNFKVLEAMALGLPVVANPERLKGLNASEGIHFLKALTSEEYSAQISMLYNDPSLAYEISRNARSLIEKYYSWEKIGHDLLRVWKQ
jgi:glycosyltransferase involved in cell wall biosynthesis